MRNKPLLLLIGLLVLAVLGYYSPWIWHRGAGLSPNAYDLAEWTTLHPSVRATAVMLPSLLLRACLGLLAVMISLWAVKFKRTTRWGLLGLALLLGLTLLPPLDFFRDSSGDLNYQQQMVIGLLALVLSLGVSVGAVRFSEKSQRLMFVLAGGLACLCAGWGYAQSAALWDTLALSVTVGFGVIAFIVSCALQILLRSVYDAQRYHEQPGSFIRNCPVVAIK